MPEGRASLGRLTVTAPLAGAWKGEAVAGTLCLPMAPLLLGEAGARERRGICREKGPGLTGTAQLKGRHQVGLYSGASLVISAQLPPSSPVFPFKGFPPRQSLPKGRPRHLQASTVTLALSSPEPSRANACG